MPTKRELLKMVPAAGLAACASFVPIAVRAKGAVNQVLAAQRFRIGACVVTALSDGFLHVDHQALHGVDAAEYAALLKQAHQDPVVYRGSVNAYLIETGSETWLIDIGSGASMGNSMGDLPDVLVALGVDRSQVTKLLVTHLHPDHVGGGLMNGAIAFPNAELLVSRADFEFWTSKTNRVQSSENLRFIFDLTANVFNAYGDQVKLFENEASLAPNIVAQPLPGHTAGHTGYLLESEGKSLLFWGDVINVPEVQLARPDVAFVYDADSEQSVRTRQQILSEVARTGQIIAGMHLPFPGVGYLESVGSRYVFQPARWQYL